MQPHVAGNWNPQDVANPMHRVAIRCVSQFAVIPALSVGPASLNPRRIMTAGRVLAGSLLVPLCAGSGASQAWLHTARRGGGGLPAAPAARHTFYACSLGRVQGRRGAGCRPGAAGHLGLDDASITGQAPRPNYRKVMLDYLRSGFPRATRGTRPLPVNQAPRRACTPLRAENPAGRCRRESRNPAKRPLSGPFSPRKRLIVPGGRRRRRVLRRKTFGVLTMGYRVAVVGATGNVGREMLNILEERLPRREVVALASRRIDRAPRSPSATRRSR